MDKIVFASRFISWAIKSSFLPMLPPGGCIDDIIVGMKKTDGKYIDICDRKEAIRYAIEHGRPGDVIVLAGKGHETYQEIKGVKYDMDERVLIKEVLEELKGE